MKYSATNRQLFALVTIARSKIHAHCAKMVMKKALLKTASEDTTRDLFHTHGARIVKRPAERKNGSWVYPIYTQEKRHRRVALAQPKPVLIATPLQPSYLVSVRCEYLVQIFTPCIHW